MMSMSMSLSLRPQLSHRHEQKLVLRLSHMHALKMYEEYWERCKKHSWTIPVELLGSSEEIALMAEMQSEGSLSELAFLAQITGGAKLLVKEDQMYGSLFIAETSHPFTFNSKGLHYSAALTPSYGLIKNVPDAPFSRPQHIDFLTRMEIPGKHLDGSVGTVLVPARTGCEAFSLERTICPFLFTDFEVKDRKLRRDFRRITAARQVGRIFGGEDGEERLFENVSEHLGVRDEYIEWVDEVSEKKKPFSQLKELQENYPEVNLKNYL